MFNHLFRFIILFSVLSSAPLHAQTSAQKIETDRIENTQSVEPTLIVKIPNSVIVTRDMVVSGELLCHDNVSVYFKDEKSCTQHLESDRCPSLKITDIRQWEKITVPALDETFFRASKLRLTYDVSVFQKVTAQDQNHQSFELQSIEKNVEIGMCPDRAPQKPEIIRSERLAFDDLEVAVLQGLKDRGVNTFNSTEGPLLNSSLHNLMFSDAEYDGVQQDSIYNQIKSPQCSSLSRQHLLHFMSGEYSGNGIEQALFDSFNLYSLPLDTESKSSSCSVGVWI